MTKRQKSWNDILNEEQAVKIECSTCPSTAMQVLPHRLPENWERDKLGELHCGKCMRLARALMAEDRRRRSKREEED